MINLMLNGWRAILNDNQVLAFGIVARTLGGIPKMHFLGTLLTGIRVADRIWTSECLRWCRSFRRRLWPVSFSGSRWAAPLRTGLRPRCFHTNAGHTSSTSGTGCRWCRRRWGPRGLPEAGSRLTHPWIGRCHPRCRKPATRGQMRNQIKFSSQVRFHKLL